LAWGLSASDFAVGMVARWDPLKDHATLLRALSLTLHGRAHARCVLVGEGMDKYNAALVSLLARHGIADKVLLAGPSDDIPAVMNALDLHVLSSTAEAFPNVVAEAMATGTPCVVTNVGDAARIVGTCGWVVRPSDHDALSHSIETAIAALSASRAGELKAACRDRILQHYSLERMVAAYEATWMKAIEVTS